MCLKQLKDSILIKPFSPIRRQRKVARKLHLRRRIKLIAVEPIKNMEYCNNVIAL